jgi:hypothetical protein
MNAYAILADHRRESVTHSSGDALLGLQSKCDFEHLPLDFSRGEEHSVRHEECLYA